MRTHFVCAEIAGENAKRHVKAPTIINMRTVLAQIIIAYC